MTETRNPEQKEVAVIVHLRDGRCAPFSCGRRISYGESFATWPEAVAAAERLGYFVYRKGC